MPTAAELEDEGGEAEPQPSSLPQMECQPFERYDFIMLMFRNEQDFQQACERLEIKKVEVLYPGGRTKVGLGLGHRWPVRHAALGGGEACVSQKSST